MKGFIFDLDGVIVFTDKFHYQAWKQMADELGIYFDEIINNRLRGVSRMASLEIILERWEGEPLSQERKEELCEQKNGLYRQLLASMTPADVPEDVRATLAELRARGYKLAIGSSSKNTPFILERVALTDAFDAVSDGNNITHSKPDPEVFLKAAEFLGLAPADCAVIEDARAGIDAAKAGGFTAIGIGEAAAYERADIPIQSLSELLKLAPAVSAGTRRTCEINIRDPFVMLHEGVYYLYGTRSETCWGPAEGFDCYCSEDLEHWEGPFEIFRRPEDFFADREYWAPECYACHGQFYLLTTLGAAGRKKGIYTLVADSPKGPFRPFGERLTPADWSCIDGTLYFENGTPWLIFSHSFEDSPDGDMCAVKLTDDLSRPQGEILKLFSAAAAPWAKPVPFAKAEFGMEGDVYFTDGPCVMRCEDGKLLMTWSSWGNNGYAVGVAQSALGSISGPWYHQHEPIYPENGGHGMLFRDKTGQLYFTLHAPNDKYRERPQFLKTWIENGMITLEKPDQAL